ncbi:MAG: preprotein translocase subunit SecA, partial [Mycoplasmataceae bacterium]|nr:preprotein translocase subunit SecA [Mycoplasmataceae bacterium]
MKIFRSAEMKKAEQEVILINELSSQMKALSDSDLQAKTTEFKQRLSDGETTDDIRVEVFAVSREATERILKKRPYDVQVLGGLILDYGSVAEMRTGEGKTITSIAPVYLNALTGKGVLVSTVNEYLTRRDAEETGLVHDFMGMSVGINEREMQEVEKRFAYSCDITYSIHSEVGFDYLRDNMVKQIENKVQRQFNFALIDEVDSILIDEARTPLIITGGEENASSLYMAANQFSRTIKKEDFEIDWESKSIQLTYSGIDKANKFFGVKNVFNIENSELIHRILNALRANYIMFKDSEYIVHEDQILLVDAFTGRIMEGRSYSDGLQQALQAKETVKIDPETKTMATITYQNLFRMFTKLSGMSGTAVTEEDEFIDIYNMRVNVIPTNMPIIRTDEDDNVYVEKQFKYRAIVKEIKERNIKGQPILVGTEEVSESEKLSSLLKDAGVKHTVLNAKQNETEADIIAVAGEKNAVTIATNMAGRGTDIKLTPDTVALGGLYVIGTSKAESRRIDNQLKGRSGR